MLFLCLIIIFLNLNEFTLAFTPTNTVWGHSAALADSKIYFTGGLYPKSPSSFDGVTFSKEFYYLDVNTSFDVGKEASLPWVDLSPVSQILPSHSWSAFSNCGINNTLVLYVGEFGAPAAVNLSRTVYTYEIKSKLWSNPQTTNQPQFNVHSQTQTVCDVKTGKMFKFSGLPPPSANPPIIINNNMDILDTSTLAWGVGSAVASPEARYDHTATLLPSGYIVYIGGTLKSAVGVDNSVDMSKIPLYNVNDDTWATMTVPGYLPSPRAYHSAVLTNDGRIIVYGGVSGSVPAVDDLVILDTSKVIFTWSKANVSTNSPPSRFYHTATLVGDLMIVAFGRNNINIPLPNSNEIFILDTSDKSDYKWVNKFTPPDPSKISTTTTSDSTSTPTASSVLIETNKNNIDINRNLIIGVITLSVTLALIGGFLFIYFYIRRRKSRPDLLISGNI